MQVCALDELSERRLIWRWRVTVEMQGGRGAQAVQQCDAVDDRAEEEEVDCSRGELVVCSHETCKYRNGLKKV